MILLTSNQVDNIDLVLMGILLCYIIDADILMELLVVE